MSLSWSWLAAPYFLVTIALVATGAVASLTRGDRVLRIGVLGASAAAVPWGLTSGFAACATDPAAAERLLRVGNGPVALIGPTILLVLLGVSGQLERHRYLLRVAGLLGLASMCLTWGTNLVIAGSHVTPSGLRYVTAGPLLGIHIGLLGIWLAVGWFIARRTTGGDRRRRQLRLLGMIVLICVVGTSDWLLAYDLAGYYPLAPIAASLAAMVTLYLVARTDLLRPRGLDGGVVIEAGAFGVTALLVAALVRSLGGASPLLLTSAGAVAWALALAGAWAWVRRRNAKVRGERRLDQFQSELGDDADEAAIERRLAALWREALALGTPTMWLATADGLERLVPGRSVAARTQGDAARWRLAPALQRWLIDHPEPFAAGDLATMRLGALRPGLVAVATAHGAPLIVPMIDRGELVGLVEVERGDQVLREDERGLIVEAARAAARALTFITLTRDAARAGAAAREVEVAEAMRTAAARRDDALGRWSVMVEYRPGARTSGAAWSTRLLADGRLAVLVLEGEARGVPAALATAALIGAFAAATVGDGPVERDALLATLRASVAVGRGAEPIAAFVAVLEAAGDAAGDGVGGGGGGRVQWACAGHPGGLIVDGRPVETGATPVGPVPLAGPGVPLPATAGEIARGEAALAASSVVVIGSPGAQRAAGARWAGTVAARAGAAGARLAAGLIDDAARARAGRALPDEDLLVLVIRRRADA